MLVERHREVFALREYCRTHLSTAEALNFSKSRIDRRDGGMQTPPLYRLIKLLFVLRFELFVHHPSEYFAELDYGFSPDFWFITRG